MSNNGKIPGGRMRAPFRGSSLAGRTRVAGCTFLLGLGSLAAHPTDPQAFLPPHSTVVLLAGLPGDLESDNTYRDQLQTWLEIVQVSGAADRIFVLSDNAESVILPEKNNASTNYHSPLTIHDSLSTLLHADRTNFLALGQTLAGATNPLVVIAWGHGGRQGATPVLHVRGPRLTPADFKAVGGQAMESQSRWVLLFRGSGAFAKQLAAEHRQILSSERDTMFTSDPVGMSLLLKLARADPATSFEKLTEAFGQATAAWYTERKLARTEEPTLWTANEPPRLLATASETNSFASAKPDQARETPPPPVPEAEPAPTNLPPAWKEITRVEPQSYPDADGVILRRRLSYTLGSIPAVATEHEQFIQILTPEGKRFGDFDISYSPPFEEINFLDCEVLPPTGKLVRLDPDAIREGREDSVGDYHSGRRKIFSLPGVVPRAVLHVRYRTQWKDFPLPRVSLEIPIGQDLPALDSVIQISVPKDAPFHFAIEDLPSSNHASRITDHASSDPSIKQTAYGSTYIWHFENLPAQLHDILAPPHQQSRLLISTYADWAAFAKWYARISKLADEVTPEISSKAAELTRNAKSEREKVRAIYDYVTNLRYVAVPLGVNSFRPHAASNVLQNQYGDCKDKANLLNTLLHALKIEAHLVLVPRFSQAHDAIPGLAFNHAISRVTLGDETLWVDTTDDVCPFGLLPPGDPGRKVLVIDGQANALTQLPEPDPKAHRLKLRGKVDCSDLTDALPVSLDATASGYPDYELRATARETKEHGISPPLLAARFRPAAGSFALDKQNAASPAALEENFFWHAEGALVGLSSTPALQHSNTPTLLHSPFWLPKEWDLALHQRKGALFLNEGYPLTLDEEFAFELPTKVQVFELPGLAENDQEPLRWRIEWANGSGTLTARFTAELARGELSLAETSRFQMQLRALMFALAASAGVSLPGSNLSRSP